MSENLFLSSSVDRAVVYKSEGERPNWLYVNVSLDNTQKDHISTDMQCLYVVHTEFPQGD